jgi:hypothetical protein
MIVNAPADFLADLADGRPLVIVDSRLPDIVALHGAGARIVRAHADRHGLTLRHSPPRGVEEPLARLATPLPGVLALVAQTEASLRRLAAWWQEQGEAPPLVVVAESGLAALPELMAAALARAEAAARRVAALEAELAALRAEAGAAAAAPPQGEPHPDAPAPRIVRSQPVLALQDGGGTDLPPIAEPPAPPPPPAAPPAASAPAYGEAVLDAWQTGTDWELLDLRLRDLAFRGEGWPEVKFKFGVSQGDVTVEFRQSPSWPRCFTTWPGTESDAFGDKFVLVIGAEEVLGLERIAAGRDRALVTALAGIMPALVAEVLVGEEAEACVAAAGRFAARLGPGA